jgi:hypothetical protein
LDRLKEQLESLEMNCEIEMPIAETVASKRMELRPLAEHEIDEVNGGFSPSAALWTLIRFLGGIGVL